MLTEHFLETANRHLEQLDILFASDSPLAWRCEKEFALKINVLEQTHDLTKDEEKAGFESTE